MEPGIYLTALVFAVAGLHLLNKTITHVSKFLAASGMMKNESASNVPTYRDDWYMFFHRSDLTGEPKKTMKKSKDNKNISSSSGKYKRRDSRPVLRSYLS